MRKVGSVPRPPDFRYDKVEKRGRPVHKKTDAFSIRHPHMDIRKRAKIFAPFDALRGFSVAIDESLLAASRYDTCIRSAEDPELALTLQSHCTHKP